MAHLREVVDRPYAAFHDRDEAGRTLAQYLLDEGATVDLVSAVPSGGVAVARPLAERLGVPLDMLLVRKLPLPMAPEAGFGAVTLGGQVVLNDALVHAWHLTEEDIRHVVDSVLAELRQREREFLADRPSRDTTGRHVLLVDDGLASGFTMRVAVQEMRRGRPRSVSVAVPDAPISTIEALDPLVDDLYCLVGQNGGSFAVASFYRHWHDLTDREVLELLDRPGHDTAG